MKLADWRVRQGLSQPDLAKKLNTTPKTISSWENGHTIPGREDMARIHRETGEAVSANDFYGLGADALDPDCAPA